MITAEKFEEAIMFAIEKHKGQIRKGDKRPYILHPMSVMNRVYNAKKSTNMFLLGAAAILHDTVEDCKVTIEEIAAKFGYNVASIVQELTLDKLQYENIGKTKYLIQELIGMSSYALTIKLCDRLDNVCDMKDMKPEFQDYYKEQTLQMMDALEAKRDKLTKTHKKIIKDIRKQLK